MATTNSVMHVPLTLRETFLKTEKENLVVHLFAILVVVAEVHQVQGSCHEGERFAAAPGLGLLAALLPGRADEVLHVPAMPRQ